MHVWNRIGAALAVAVVMGCGERAEVRADAFPFRTTDGFTIHADLTLPSGAARGEGSRPALVLLAHDLGATRHTWDPLVPLIVEQGWASLAVDLRGFGESTAEAARPAELDQAARANLHLDLLGALDAAGTDGRADTSRVVVVAAGLSVTPAVRTAIERSCVQGLVLVTGLIEETEEIHLRERPDFPVLLVAAETDERGRYLMRQYAARLTGPVQDYVELPAGEAPAWRGTDGLAAESGLAEHILWFIERAFGPSADEGS